MNKLRVVFDCMVFLQGAARKEGPAGVCLDLAWRGVIELCVSQQILDEVANVLFRPSIRKKFPALNDAMVAAFIAGMQQQARFFNEVPRSMKLPRDPKDEPYLNLALHVEPIISSLAILIYSIWHPQPTSASKLLTRWHS